MVYNARAFMAHLCTHEVYVTIAVEEHSISVTRQDANKLEREKL